MAHNAAQGSSDLTPCEECLVGPTLLVAEIETPHKLFLPWLSSVLRPALLGTWALEVAAASHGWDGGHNPPLPPAASKAGSEGDRSLTLWHNLILETSVMPPPLSLWTQKVQTPLLFLFAKMLLQPLDPSRMEFSLVFYAVAIALRSFSAAIQGENMSPVDVVWHLPI